MKKLFFFLFALLPLHALANDRDCYDMDSFACEVFYRTNEQRIQNGRAPMVYCARCFAMAQEQSQDMADRDYFSHQRPVGDGSQGETFSQRAARFGLSQSVGENIALVRSPESAVERWMKSAGHRRNILNANYDQFAVGQAEGRYTQVFSRRPESKH